MLLHLMCEDDKVIDVDIWISLSNFLRRGKAKIQALLLKQFFLVTPVNIILYVWLLS